MSLDGLDTRALRQILAVARTGSMRAAADALDMAPSAVSRQIAAVERHLGIALFERTTRGVVLAEAGRIVAEHARERLDGEACLKERLARLGSAEQNVITIVAGGGFVGDFIANAVPSFRAAHPRARFSVRLAGADRILEQVLNGEAEIGLAYHLPPTTDVRVVARALRPLFVIAPAGHPVANAPSLSLSEATGHDFALLSPGSGVRQIVGVVAAEHGIVLAPVLEAGSIETLRQFVAAGLGLTFLPPFAIAEEIARGTAVAIPLTDPEVAGTEAKLVVRARRRLPDTVARAAEHAAATMLAFRD